MAANTMTRANQEIINIYNSLTPGERDFLDIYRNLSANGKKETTELVNYLRYKGTNVKPMISKPVRQYINLHKL